MVKKADIFLIALLLLAGIGLWLFFSFSPSADGDAVVITVNGKETGRYPLSEDREIPIRQGGLINVVAIKGGAVWMTEANCSGRECIRRGSITKSGESIICLPHRVVAEIVSEDSPYDAIVS